MQSALFNFQSLLLVILLLICTCTYIRAVAPRLIDSNKQGCVSSFLVVRTSSPPSFPLHDTISFRMHVLSHSEYSCIMIQFLGYILHVRTNRYVCVSIPRLFRYSILFLTHLCLPLAAPVSVCLQEKDYRHTSRWRALQWPCG